MNRYAIALGSNLEDRMGNLGLAVDGLAEFLTVVAASGIYESEPVGGPKQGAFLNAVVLVDTVLGPEEMLVQCTRIETFGGRVREERWGPRTIDLDIVAWDGGPHRSEQLEIPHPRAHQRAFVLLPLVELWPDVLLADGRTAADALAGLDVRGIALAVQDWNSWTGL